MSHAPNSAPCRTFTYAGCCVNADAEAISQMQEQAQEVTYATVRGRLKCALRDWAASMGYVTVPHERGLRLKNDWHVRYYRSRYCGTPCYYIVHSATEYVFTANS